MLIETEPVAPSAGERPRLTFWDYAVPVRKRWKLICLLVVVWTAVVTAYVATRPVSYSTATEVYVAPGTGVAGNSVSSTQAVADQAAFLTSTETAATVARKIHYPGAPAGLAGSISASVSQATNFLTISSSQASAALAVRVVNAYAREFIAENSGAVIHSDQSQIAALQRQLRTPAIRANPGQAQEINAQISQLRVAADAATQSTRQIDVATSAAVLRKSPTRYGAAAALVSLIGAILLAFALEGLDPRFRTVREAADAYHRRVLSTVLHDGQIDDMVDGRPTMSPRSRESFRQLQVTLDFMESSAPLKTTLITSAVPGEGKSTVARNLALALSEAGRRTVLIDADLRKPRLSMTLGATRGAGLSQLCEGSRTLEDVLVKIPAGSGEAGELWFIPAGPLPDSPAAMFGSEGFHALLRRLSERFDAVVIDSTPVLAVADALPIVRVVDAVVLVARTTTDSRSALRASEVLELVPHANIAGLVINGVPDREAAGYGYGDGYRYSHREAEAVASQLRGS